MLKQKFTFVLKYFVGFALLIWILARIDRQQMMQTLLSIKIDSLLIVLALSVVNLTVQYRRWKFLIEQQSSDFNARDLIPSFFAGFTLRLILPGGHAEISKVFLLPGKKSGKVMAFAVEKFFQTYVKFVLVLAGLPFLFPAQRWIFIGLLFLAVAVYPFLPRVWGTNIFRKFQEKEVNYHRIFLRALLYSLGVFICLILQYYVLLNAAHSIEFNQTMLVVIYIWGAGLIPVSVSGLGVRENIAAILLKHYGIPASTAVGLSLFVFFINAIIPALVGIFFLYRRQHHFKDAQTTLKKVSNQLYEYGKKQFYKR